MHRSALVRPRALTLLALTLPVATLAGSAHAWLGGFEQADGYQPFLNMVQNYNAGQHGANSGYGGSFAPIAPNSGLWQAQAGGFSSLGAISYATGHQWYDRNWVNGTGGNANDQALVLTTGHEGWNGPALQYKYSFDANDFGGNAPASTAGGQVALSFWSRGQLAGPEIGGQVPDGYFGNEMAFADSSGNVAFRLGLTQRAGGDRVTFWNGSSLFESAIIADNNAYDRWDIGFDLATNTVSASYFDFSTSTLIPLFTGVPMQSPIANLSAFTYRTSPGVNNAKLTSIDDFTINARIIPTPGALALLGASGLLAARRRR
jgi:hypothetical protein